MCLRFLGLLVVAVIVSISAAVSPITILQVLRPT